MPNFFSKIFNRANRKSFLVSSLQNLFNLGDPARPTDLSFLDSYQASYLVYRCVRVISESVSLNGEPKLYRIRNNDAKEIDNHKLLDLLAKPNPRQTRFEFFDLTQTFLELTGNAYWLKVRDEGGKKLLGLEILRPDWVRVEVDKEGRYKYIYESNNVSRQEFSERDVIHLKDPNPKSHIYGQGVVEPTLDLIKSLVFMIRWDMNFFLNNARPDYLITTKTRLSETEKTEFLKRWEAKFKGLGNAHKVALMSGEVEIKDLNFTMQDMQMTALSESFIDQILMAFGVPRSVIGMKGMNRAEAEAQLVSFLSQTIEPKIKRLFERLNEFLVSEFEEGLWLDYDDPTPENREAILTEYDSALKNNWMVINEVRDREGLPPLKGGWDFYLPINVLPAGNPNPNSTGEKSGLVYKKIGSMDPIEYRKHKREQKNKRIVKRALEGKRAFRLKEKLAIYLANETLKSLTKKKKVSKLVKKSFTKEQKAHMWMEHEKALDKHEKLFMTMTKRLIKGQMDRALDAVKEQYTGGSNPKDPDLLDWDAERKIFEEGAKPVVTEIIKDRGQKADSFINKGKAKKDFIINEAVFHLIAGKIFSFSREVNDTTRDRLRIALQEGIKLGEGVVPLGKRIGDVFDERLKGWELQRIARTETSEISNRAELISYKQNGVKKKEWLTEPDAPDAACKDNDGQVVDINDDFSSGDETPPVHPNCRCTVLPVVESFTEQEVGVPEWSPVMSAEEAERWNKDSKIKYELYHGTDPKNIASIKSGGFNPGNGAWGNGVYFADSFQGALPYTGADGVGIPKRSGVLKVKINVDRFKEIGSQDNFYKEVFKMQKGGESFEEAQRRFWGEVFNNYDGFSIENLAIDPGGSGVTQYIIFDNKKIAIIE